MLMNESLARWARARQLGAAQSAALLAPALAGFTLAPPVLAQPAAPASSASVPAAPVPAASVPPAPAPPPTAAPSAFPPIAISVWTRSAAAIQGEEDPETLDDIRFESNFAEVNFSGQIHENARVITNVFADGLSGNVRILDALVGFDFTDEAHLWVGQLLIPVDRANKAGPFFSIPWNFFAGAFAVGTTRLFITPIEGSFGRGTGGVFWGDLLEGKLKYLLGAFLDAEASTSPLYSGRVGYSFLGKEKAGFGQSATFYGQAEGDVVTLAVGGQYRKDGSVAPAPPAGATPPPVVPPADDFAEVNADLFAELKLGDGAFVTGEVDYYQFSGDNQPANNLFSVMAAYASPVIGVGQLQPMVRFQLASGDNDFSAMAIDAQLGYLIRQQRLRLIANFQHTQLKGVGAEDLSGNKLQLAVQAQFF